MRTINDFEMIEPMRYYDNPAPKTATLAAKRQDMIDNKDNLYIASRKNDGDWSMLIHYARGKNLIRSRSISKVTGVYGDYTAKVPHICDAMDLLPDNTVLLAELCWDEPGTNANTVGTILRCLPAKAVEKQKNKKLKAVIFDALMINGVDFTDIGYEQRWAAIHQLCSSKLTNHAYLYPTTVYYDNFAEEADKIISAGGEGLVIQRRTNPYMPGTRTAWATLKLKQALPHMDLKVVDTLEPNKLYNGDFAEDWQFKIDGVNVTKPYYMGWKNGIRVILPSGITTDVTSGLSDDDRAYLATDEAKAKIAAGELWAEVKAMSINDLGKLRHPALVRLRTDLNSKGE